MKTSVLPVDARRIGRLTAVPRPNDLLDDLEVQLSTDSQDAEYLCLAAERLRSSDIPVAFPTETVYGLGADATRSSAVKGIYKAKQRPSDNPLIVHFGSLQQLRALLSSKPFADTQVNGHAENLDTDPIPEIYRPLIAKFWPGPLTIILPNPKNSPLAPEVTAGLSTFGARMPKHALALALIKLANVPIAAPSANASTKPSPTAAEHVAYDLGGRIETIIDGGPCDVGMESTVVDGLSNPPLILRPGGISIEQLRTCPGWEKTEIGYKNVAELGSQPRAPGMKYRHYSPKAPVVLFETGTPPPSADELSKFVESNGRIGFVRTKTWIFNFADHGRPVSRIVAKSDKSITSEHVRSDLNGFACLVEALNSDRYPTNNVEKFSLSLSGSQVQVIDIALGTDIADIARGTFAALRELDKQNVSTIVVEGIDDAEGGTAAAVMNRLRKAAEIQISS
ncbi:Threonylcarbamoyl-AMP synthase [Acrodontium crateriforme]|uniref:Threonylcarbamoyl-AMP synthase n=1 Tax=Acrodontium crateriforme TaxID=150365 RepID=A0AAQ3RBR7_9PEZI|nr:Threonylcarbamoyl-AMP synthase [Acrodontium crateriforme]